jgi:polar amino acid transport system substrate-binding protein
LGQQIQVLNMPCERSLISANTGFTDGGLYRKAGLEAACLNLLMLALSDMDLASTLDDGRH